MKASNGHNLWRWLFAATFIANVLWLAPLIAQADDYADDEGDQNELADEVDDDNADEALAIDSRPAPEEFPSVTLVSDSVPRYGAVRLDPWGENVLYFLFDGNRERGYNRMYVWVPEGRQYARPTPMNVGPDYTFPTISWQTEKDDEVVETAYTFYSRRTVGTHGGRSARTSIDYETGKTVTRSAQSSRPYTNISLRYNLIYSRDRSPRGGDNLLRVSIPAPGSASSGSSISTSTNFASITPQAAWNNIHFRWSVDRQHDGDHDNARLRISGRAQHGSSGSNQRQVTFDTIPKGFFDLNIRVSPYMKDPVFTKTIPVIDLIRDGIMVEVPFGWYTAAYNTETHPWIGGRKISQGTRLMALGRRQPASTSRVSQDRSPASQLRGPPPSQLPRRPRQLVTKRQRLSVSD